MSLFHGKEYVYEVYKERSFSKAAQNLYVSQPSLSATIKKLEERIGAQLFDRSTSPIGMTECGMEYIRAAERLMDIENQFDEYLSDWNELKIGSLSIGGSNFFTSFMLPPMITRFQNRYPQVEIRLTEANTPLLEKQLLAGVVDLVIDNYPFDEKVFGRRFFREENLLLAVPKANGITEKAGEYQLSAGDVIAGKHLEPGRAVAPLRWFGEQPFVLLREGNDTRLRADSLFREAGIAPPTVLELDQLATAYNVACYGMGCTFVSDTLVRHLPPDSSIAFFRLDSAAARRKIYFYYRKSRYLTRAMEEFLNGIEQPGDKPAK